MADASLYLFRFRCKSLKRTVDFYSKVLEMTVQKQFRAFERWEFVYLHYPEHEDIVSLRFEFDHLAPIISTMSDDKVPRGSDPSYLLFYVRNMSDIIGRIEMGTTGAWVYAYPEQHSHVQVAIVVDPNGHTLRLVSSSADFLLKEAQQKTLQLHPKPRISIKKDARDRSSWSVRLGYLVLPTDHASGVSQYYERLFSSEITTLQDQLRNDGGHTPEESEGESGIMSRSSSRASLRSHSSRASFATVGGGRPSSRLSMSGRSVGGLSGHAEESGDAPALGTSQPLAPGMSSTPQGSRRTGLHVVDKEDFSEMLATFVWLANGQRSAHTGLCLLHKMQRKGAAIARFARDSASVDAEGRSKKSGGGATASEERSFLGIGLLVADLDTAMRELSRHVRYPVKFTNEPTHVPGIGRYINFSDPNGVSVDLLDEQTVNDMPEDEAPIESRKKSSSVSPKGGMISGRPRLGRRGTRMETAEGKRQLQMFRQMEGKRRQSIIALGGSNGVSANSQNGSSFAQGAAGTTAGNLLLK